MIIPKYTILYCFFVLAVFGDVQVKNPVFDWDNYLKETSSSAAPTYCFKQVKKKKINFCE